MSDDVKLLRLPEVCRLVTLQKTTIRNLMKRGEFPQPIKITPRATRWRRADVEAWIAARIGEAP